MRKYIPRLIDEALKKELEAFGAVLITGPKWCGKTTSGLRHAKSALFLQDPDNRRQNLEMASLSPSLLLEGEKPRLLDEWQDAPNLWDAVRHSVDILGETGLYILTGSAMVDESKLAHSGTGRISRLQMRTLSLFESGFSNGEVSLETLFKKEELSSKSDPGLEDVAEMIVRGGWPSSVDKSLDIARRQVGGYCDSIIRSEISTSDGVKRDEDKLESFLRSYSRHISTRAALTTIVKDLSGQEIELDRKTALEYIGALSSIYVVEELKAWNPRLRSKTAIATSPARHFSDPAIAAYFLDAGPKDLQADLKTFGLLFESLVIRDLRIYAQSLSGKVFTYRDHAGLEADAVIHLNNASYGLIEIKLGGEAVDKAAENLLKLRDKIDTRKMPEASFMVVITATGYAYKRPDGVYVVPIACLRN